MLKGIEEMEKASSGGFFSSEDLASWLTRSRSTGGAYLGVGSFSERSRFSSSRRFDLPEGFTAVHVDLHQVAPGVTVMTFRFDLDDENVECLNEILRQSFDGSVSAAKGRPGAQSIKTPEARKQEAIRSRRESLRGSAARWISERTPGFFSTLREVDHPAWDLLLTETDSLLRPMTEKEMWKVAIGFGHSTEAWKASGWDGLSLLNAVFDEHSAAAPSFVGEKRRALKIAENQHTTGDPAGVGYVISDEVAGLFCLWSFLLALEGYGSRFARIRDQLSGPTKWPVSVRRLRVLRDEVMPLAFDLTTVGEASRNSEALDWLDKGRGWEFETFDDREGSPELELAKVIRGRIEDRGVQIASQGQDISSALRVQGELLLASTNARLQWMVLFVSLLFGAASVYLAATH